MTSAEKAVNAVNSRIERLQATLREVQSETARRRLFESVLVTIGAGEALTCYIKQVGERARRLHGELKETHATLGEQHAGLLQSGKDQLERLKAVPTDKALRKEIEVTQQAMVAIQKTLRRGTNALQRNVAPSLAMIDKLAESIRRLSEADTTDGLKRALKAVLAHVRELYAAQQTLPSKDVIDTATWQQSALVEIEQAADFYDAYARAGYQVILAVEVMTAAVSEIPPVTAEAARKRANESLAARVKEIAGRFMTPG